MIMQQRNRNNATVIVFFSLTLQRITLHFRYIFLRNASEDEKNHPSCTTHFTQDDASRGKTFLVCQFLFWLDTQFACIEISAVCRRIFALTEDYLDLLSKERKREKRKNGKCPISRPTINGQSVHQSECSSSDIVSRKVISSKQLW